MKKALHDALGYLWVKNSLEAEKRGKEEIANENARIQIAVDDRRNYNLCVKWWGTTDLGYTGNTFVYPSEIKWLPKKEMIKVLKERPYVAAAGIWWNPKFGDMEDYFAEAEMKEMRYSIRERLEAGDRRMNTLPGDFKQTSAYENVQTEEIIKGIMPRTTFEEAIKDLEK